MKQLIASLLILISIVSCNSGNSEKHHILNSADTIRTLMLYESPKGELIYGIGYRMTKDSFGFVNVDSNTSKKQWYRDTAYFIPYIDSSRDKLTGKPLVDSAGKPLLITYWTWWPRYKVKIDGLKNIDSIQVEFDKAIKDSIARIQKQ